MSRRSPYGKKGGESPTAGRRIETIEAVFADGTRARRRVFLGQRAMALVQRTGADNPTILKCADLTEAWRCLQQYAEPGEALKLVRPGVWQSRTCEVLMMAPAVQVGPPRADSLAPTATRRPRRRVGWRRGYVLDLEP